MSSKKTTLLWLLFLAFFVLGYLINQNSTFVSAVTDKNYENLKVFSDILYTVQKDYVEETNVDDLVEGAINGMLNTLDPHTSYLPPDLYKEMQVETKGRFGGLGIELTVKDGILTVVAPIEDTPAFRAGIKAGDQIFKINSETTKNMTLVDAVKKLRGKKGTSVTISVMREGLTQLQEHTIIRDIIEIKSVKHKTLYDKFGYIRVTQFQEQTTSDFKKALDEIETKIPSLAGLILDLRNNPGGLLQQAVEISDEFIDSGLIVYTEGRSASQKIEFEAHKKEKVANYPLVALVNAGSASGSEIVAGALQDHKRALIVGTPTFGKGTVQTIIPLDNGGGLRLTTAKYFTPNGRSIHAKGIEPDIIVEDQIEGPEKETNPVRFLREKDLEEHLGKTNTGEVPKNDDTESSAVESSNDNFQDDPPLNRAVELLKSWEIFQGKQSTPGN
ncbi:MAG: S41 family peptidase [Deltaproteobacteria bacterium]|nr:S41 family peptidase [Deltaproteobacteria bacterium]